RRLTKRRILKEIAPLRFGEGHDCSFPAALAAATKTEYDWLMGCSAAAFTATIDEAGWDPLAATPRDPDTLGRAAHAAGVRLDPEPPPYDDEMRELILDRVIERRQARRDFRLCRSCDARGPCGQAPRGGAISPRRARLVRERAGRGSAARRGVVRVRRGIGGQRRGRRIRRRSRDALSRRGSPARVGQEPRGGARERPRGA